MRTSLKLIECDYKATRTDMGAFDRINGQYASCDRPTYAHHKRDRHYVGTLLSLRVFCKDTEVSFQSWSTKL